MADVPKVKLYDSIFTGGGELFRRIENEIQYLPSEKCLVRIRGKEYSVPRQIAAYGDLGLSYTFSGLTLKSQPWIPLLLDLKATVEEVSGYTYNFVVINRYKDGNCCIGQHKDNEKDLDPSYPISIVSLGETRKMIFKQKDSPDYTMELKDNSLLIMGSQGNWTHGIPREKQRNGVRISLTFRKMHTKRKNEDSDTSNKRNKKDYEGTDLFVEEEIPKNVFPFGCDMFVVVSSFREKVIIHLRRYKKFGKTFYPTREGVTLFPWWFDHLFCRPCPNSAEKLQSAMVLFPAEEFQVASENFVEFSLTRFQNGKHCAITIKADQWNAINQRRGDITTMIVNCLFQNVDFKTVYESIEDIPLAESLSSSLDVSVGTEYVTRLLFEVICDLLKGEGLCSPMLYDDNVVVCSNDIEEFNSLAISLELSDIGNLFRERLWENTPRLALPTAQYVTKDFLKSVCLKNLIVDARNTLCPPCNE